MEACSAQGTPSKYPSSSLGDSVFGRNDQVAEEDGHAVVLRCEAHLAGVRQHRSDDLGALHVERKNFSKTIQALLKTTQPQLQ
jgi:hypothetical protein